MIIAFFGPDGSGKTTIARLIELLLNKKYKVNFVHLRIHHLFICPLIKFLQKLKILPYTHSPRILNLSMREKFCNSKIMILLELLATLFWLFLNVKLKEKLGYLILAERYIPDFIVSLHVIYNLSLKQQMIINILFRTFTKNAVLIYLYASPQILLKRKANENLSKTYLFHLMLNYYIYLKNNRNNYIDIISIDTTYLSIKETLELVFNFVKKYL